MRKTTFLIIFTLFLLVPSIVQAKVVINEVLNNPSGDEAGSEWVELYNLNDKPESLSNCELSLDDNVSTQKVIFDTEDFIDKYKVISWDSSWLNNSGDQISLTCPDFSDTVSYGNHPGALVDEPNEDFTFGRSPDGTGNFYILATMTLGSANSNPPTSTPTKTNTPTTTPKPTNTNTPTPTPKPTNTPTNKPTLTPTPEVLSDEAENKDGYDTDSEKSEKENNKDKETNTDENNTKSNGKVPILAYIFVISGTGLIGAAAFPLLKPYIKRYNFKRSRRR